MLGVTLPTEGLIVYHKASDILQLSTLSLLTSASKP